MNALQKKAINASAQNTGKLAEEEAECYLIEHGLQLVERNFRAKTGEIDLIMRDKDSVVFVEVRCRKSVLFGGAVASVDRKKQMKLIRTAQYYLMSHAAAANKPCRFDVIAMQRVSANVAFEGRRNSDGGRVEAKDGRSEKSNISTNALHIHEIEWIKNAFGL